MEAGALALHPRQHPDIDAIIVVQQLVATPLSIDHDEGTPEIRCRRDPAHEVFEFNLGEKAGLLEERTRALRKLPREWRNQNWVERNLHALNPSLSVCPFASFVSVATDFLPRCKTQPGLLVRSNGRARPFSKSPHNERRLDEERTRTTDTAHKRLLPRSVIAGALALGVVGGGYGIASAANGSGSTAATTTTTVPAITTPALPLDSGHQGWGGQRSDETLLTGDTLASVTAARRRRYQEHDRSRSTDADGNAADEAHLTAADGSRTTVYVDKSFNVVGVDSR